MPKFNISNRRLSLWVALFVLFAWAYWPTLVRMVETWRSDPDYTHGFLVVPIALAIWLRRRDGAESFAWQTSVGGLSLLAVAAVLRLVAARYYLMPIDTWSIPLWLAGVVWTFAGWQVFRVALPSLAFLWFATPLPERVELMLSVPLQERAAGASAWILQSMCQPAVAAGTTLLLGAETYEVEYACSGLRMFLGTFAMATAFVLLGSQGRLVNGLLILLAAPIAMLANVIRIVATAYLHQHASTELVRRFVHDFAGILMIGFVFGAYVLVLYTVRQARRSHKANRDRFVKRLPYWPITAVLVVIVAVIWQSRQEQRVFASLLDTAAMYEESGEWAKASDYLDRYLQFRRDDSSTMRRLAFAVQHSAMSLRDQRRALTLMTAASRANPDDIGLATQQANLAWDLRQYNQVVSTTATIFEHPAINRTGHESDRQTAARLRAWAMYEVLRNSDDYAPYNWADVADALEGAIEFDANNPQHAFRLAIIYRERLNRPSQIERNQRADQLIDQLVKDTPDVAEAWLVKYRYRRRFQRTEDASVSQLASIDGDLDRALNLDRQTENRNVHILIAVAERMRERGEIAESLTNYQLALQANPRDVRPYLSIGEIWTERGTKSAREKAVEVLQQGLAIIGSDEVPLIFPLIEQLVMLDRDDDADSYLAQAEQALERFPDPIRVSYRVQLQHVKSWRLAKNGEFAAAARTLEQLLDALSSKYAHASNHYVAQSWANVGQYCRMSGDWGQASHAYQRAAALDDVWRLEYRWALARQAEFRGELGDAAQQYREIAASADESLNAWIQAAAIALRQQVLLPPAIRDWTQFRRAIDAAKSVADDEMDQVIVLEANQLLILGQVERVIRNLVEALKKYPDSPALHRSLALVQARSGDLRGALMTAERMNPIGGDPTASLLLSKDLLCQANQYEDAIEIIKDAIENEVSEDGLTLQLELAWLYMHRARWQEARQWLDSAAEIDSRDLRITEALSELAWCLEDWKLLEECESSLRGMEGIYGPLWRTFRIRRLLAQTDSEGDEDTLSESEIDGLAHQLEVLFPHMQQTRIAAGRVATYRGQLWRAVANYEEAWELGLPRVSLAVDLIGLLNELGDTDRAQRYVVEIRRFLSATQIVIDRSFLDLANESADEAIRMAEALVADAPRSDSYLRLGRTLVLTALPNQSDYLDRLTRAEQAFRQAVEIDPTNTRTWAALFRYLVAVTPDPVESQSLLRSLAERTDISQLNRTFALAQLNESIKNYSQADRLFREAIELTEQYPDRAERIVVLERTAQYFRRFEPELSETCCRNALVIDDLAIGPKRILLDLLLAKKTREASVEATQLVDSLSEMGLGSDQWKRLQARVLLRASEWDDDVDGSRRRAIDLLERVTNKLSSDSLLLAELFLLRNQQAAAITEMRLISQNLPADGDAVLRFLREYDERLYADTRSRMFAERIYDHLEEMDAYKLAALDLRLETALRRTGATYAERQSFASSMISQYAHRAVEQASTEHGQIEEVVKLMAHLIASGRWEQAQQLTRLEPPLLALPRIAAALATSLSLSDSSWEQTKLLSHSLDAWLAKYPDDAELLFAVANQRFIYGKNEQAIALFHRSLKKFPHHSASLNNLALALAAEDPSSLDESFRLVNRAIELDGRETQWLDTLAVLHLVNGQYDVAITLLLEALRETEGDETVFLHLAKAWMEQGDESLAVFALGMAESMSMTGHVMTPLDRQMYQQIANQLRVSAL